jgi:formylglycine-generating enzyme required for sulfatase activity
LQYNASEELVTSTGQRLRLIPPGVFTYTRPANSTVLASLPIEIRLTEAYYCGVGEVTVDQFRQFVEATGYQTDAERDGGARKWDRTTKDFFIDEGKTWRDPGYEQEADHPVVCVSWNDAQAFCEWLSEQEGRGFELPTHAQWEWAGRAGAEDEYYFGDDVTLLADYAVARGFKSTASVTLKKPNAFGIHGILGNVSEFMADSAWQYQSEQMTDPFGFSDGVNCTHRGGAFGFSEEQCVIAKQGYLPRNYALTHIGFRVISPVDWRNSEEELLKAAWSQAAQQQQQASEELDRPIVWENSLGMQMRLIPAGEAIIGSPETEIGRGEDETPFRARITRPFYLGETEVTVAQFRAFVEATNHFTNAEGAGLTARRNNNDVQGLYWKEPGYLQTDRHPVVMIRSNDAREFCDWLSRKEGKTYRLPTEAEWEYACRAGTTTPRFFSRREDISDYIQVGLNSNNSARPVGLLKPNPWGLYDTLGNLAEWCNDWYGEYPHGLATDPPGPANGDRGVTRGGHFRLPVSELRSALREASRELHSDVIGFRVLLEIDASSVDSGEGNLGE